MIREQEQETKRKNQFRTGQATKRTRSFAPGQVVCGHGLCTGRDRRHVAGGVAGGERGQRTCRRCDWSASGKTRKVTAQQWRRWISVRVEGIASYSLAGDRVGLDRKDGIWLVHVSLNLSNGRNNCSPPSDTKQDAALFTWAASW